MEIKTRVGNIVEAISLKLETAEAKRAIQTLKKYGFIIIKRNLFLQGSLTMLFLIGCVFCAWVLEVIVSHAHTTIHYRGNILAPGNAGIVDNLGLDILAKTVGGYHWPQLVLVFGGMLFALQRWIVSREDESINRYFEQRRAINDQIISGGPETWRLVRSAFPKGEFAWTADIVRKYMSVFAELDQLEFCFEKYKLRLIAPQVAYRACQILESRCEGYCFRQIAEESINNGRYNEDFIGVVKKIVSAAGREKVKECITQ